MSDKINVEQLHAAIEADAELARQWLMQMIRYPSTQGHEQEMVAYTKGLLDELGIPAELREIPDSIMDDPLYNHNENECSYAGRHNIVSVQGGERDGRSLIVNTHMDVVPGDDWGGYDPKWDGEFVTGRGAMDCKGDVVMILLALKALKAQGYEPAGKLEVHLVLEEEPGGNGALSLIRQGVEADACIVCEASDMNVFPANRGAVWFRAKTTGISTHMGRRHEGVNAIEKMMEAIRWMLVYEEELIAQSKGNPLFDRYENPVQVCIGMIHAGQWPSKVPDECVVEGGVGFLPNKTLDQVRAEFEAAIMRTDDEWLKEHFEIAYPKLKKDAYEIDPKHPVVTTMHEAALGAGLKSEVFGWNVSCDAALYAKVAGIPTIVFGPSDIREAHGQGEKVRLADIISASKALAVAIANWCG
ncbi:MAG: ArgE/DapE family deacylase [Armatimonadetes bacterium]|nr:ArgE/DapE family deacylase [Armatimonadota bacterium]